MKKRLLLGALALIGTLVLAAAIFIATFNVDRYRPQLVHQLENTLGRPVQLDRLALGWRGGLAIELRGLAIADELQAGEPMLEIESASAIMRLVPLLRRELEVASVVLMRPKIHVHRDAQGHINLLGLAVAASPAAGGTPSPAGKVPARSAASPAAATGQRAVVGDRSFVLRVGTVRITDGAVHWTDQSATSPADVWLKRLDVQIHHIVQGQPMDLDARGALASDTPNVRLHARLTLPRGSTTQTGPGAFGSVERMSLTVERLPLDRLLAAPRPGMPQLEGTFTAELEGSVASLDPARLTQAVTGHSHLKLTDMRVTNFNVLREVFGRFSMLPGLVETLEARLPPEYQAKLAAHETVFSPVELTVRVEDGAIQWENLQLRSDTFRLTGAGRVGFDGSLAMRATLAIDPTLSTALIKSVTELQTLTNTSGELELPVTVQGVPGHFAVLPDLHYVASKLLASKAEELLSRVLRKALEGKEP